MPRSTLKSAAENSVASGVGEFVYLRGKNRDGRGGLLIVLAAQVRFVSMRENGRLNVTVYSCTNRCIVL